MIPKPKILPSDPENQNFRPFSIGKKAQNLKRTF